MNPIKLIKIMFYWNKIEHIFKEKTPMTPVKFTQIIALLTQLFGGIGAAAYVQTSVAGNSTTLIVLTWIAAILNGLVSIGHALLPAIFTTSSTTEK